MPYVEASSLFVIISFNTIVNKSKGTKCRQDLTLNVYNSYCTLHIVISNVPYSRLPRLTSTVEPPQTQQDSIVYSTIISLDLHKILEAISRFQQMA